MINVASKSAYLKATTQVVATGLKPLAAGVTAHKETVVEKSATPITSYSLANALPNGPLKVVSGPGGKYAFRRQLNFRHCVIISSGRSVSIETFSIVLRCSRYVTKI